MIKSLVPKGSNFILTTGDDNMHFQRLKDLREDSDMTQTKVAELLHTSQTVYSRYERGFQTIPVEHLLILADFYGVSVDYILGRTNVKETSRQTKK